MKETPARNLHGTAALLQEFAAAGMLLRDYDRFEVGPQARITLRHSIAVRNAALSENYGHANRSATALLHGESAKIMIV